ncbi:TonB-dependent receptor [Parasphingorhabdus cellanae]|uniref:TonB-dependent receptor n=1 Tax=Parasphingorhabdus cellanae TaxID=2806553 RepID=A0ABX7T8K1_9SPHN|nr:TonB-dependent receptor [Parasphingorhabdus cellanae]QTD57082.1 TonB-dependent receptor [Parasphingorhabdus cellanae]
MVRQSKRLVFTSSIALGAFICSQPAFSQTQEGNDEETSGIKTIIVTAQKVEEDLQDVPISTTVVSGEQLQDRQIDSFEQLQYVAPGVTFSGGINARQSALTVRGVGVGVFNIGVEASVALSIDGVTIGRTGAGIFDFSDVERVEVLRGPQGTLFGKNASGGVLSVITKGPTNDLTAEMNVAYGSFDEVNLSGAISGPVTDGITARISGYRNTRDGYIENINPDAPQSDLADRNEYGFRAKVNFEISDTVDFLLNVDHSRRDNTPGGLTYRQLSPDLPGTGLLPQLGPGAFNAIGLESLRAGIVPGPKNRQIASDGNWVAESEVTGISAELTASLGEHDFVSLTAWRDWDTFSEEDADLIPQPFLLINSGAQQQSQFSQEFRLSSPRDRKLTYTLGAYYFSQQIDQFNRQVGTAGLNLRSLAPGILPPILPPFALTGTDFASDFEEQNYAIFGQGEYAVTPQFSLIGGVRFLRSELEASQLLSQTPTSVSPFIIGPFLLRVLDGNRATVENDDNAITWRAGAKYDFTDDFNIFATVTQGYKSAALVTGEEFTEVGLPIARPEKPLQFEVGLRYRSVNNRLQAGITGYYTEIEDLQAQSLVRGPDGTLVVSLSNAAKAVSKGIEADLTIVPVDGLTLSGAVSYNDAKYKSFEQAPCYSLQTEAQGCVQVRIDPDDPDNLATTEAQDLSGARLANAPEWTLNGFARYDFRINDAVNAYIQGGFQYRDDSLSLVSNDPQSRIDAYTLVDAQIGVTFWDGKATMSLFGRNLTNQNFVAAIVPMPFDEGGYAQFRTFEAQRTWGARLSFRY